MDHNKEISTLRGAFPRSIPSSIKPSTSPSLTATENRSQSYAIAAEGEVLTRYRLILRSGKVYNLPYSLLPVLILEDNQQLIIKSYGIHITLKGRNLKVIEEYLTSETLLWVRESLSGTDDEEAHVFIKTIQVEGEDIKSNSEGS